MECTFKLEDGKNVDIFKNKKNVRNICNYNKNMIKYILIYHIKHVRLFWGS
jgi:hypothetical protein